MHRLEISRQCRQANRKKPEKPCSLGMSQNDKFYDALQLSMTIIPLFANKIRFYAELPQTEDARKWKSSGYRKRLNMKRRREETIRKELRKLSRADLLEMLLQQSRQMQLLEKERTELREKLNEQNLEIQNSGSLAEAALRLNGVFQAADQAAEQYLFVLQKAAERVQAEEMERTQKK